MWICHEQTFNNLLILLQNVLGTCMCLYLAVAERFHQRQEANWYLFINTMQFYHDMEKEENENLLNYIKLALICLFCAQCCWMQDVLPSGGKVQIEGHKLSWIHGVCLQMQLVHGSLTHARAFSVSVPDIRNSMASYKQVHKALTKKIESKGDKEF